MMLKQTQIPTNPWYRSSALRPKPSNLNPQNGGGFVFSKVGAGLFSLLTLAGVRQRQYRVLMGEGFKGGRYLGNLREA